MEKLNTNWSTATRNIFKAFWDLLKSWMTGDGYFITRIDNTKCAFPIKIFNPELNNPFNWTMSYGNITQQIEKTDFLNKTEEKLFKEYTVLFSTPEARKQYKGGKITKGLGQGGVCTPVKIIDANEWRKKYTKDDYKYIPMTHEFEPKDNISYYILNPKIKKVFVIAKYDIKLNQFKSKKITTQKIFIKIGLFLTYPLRYIPSYSNLKMDKYTNHTFRIGGITNGFSIEFQIPKRFGF